MYSGGFTNLEQAIDECKKTLVGSPAPVTVIIGDGNPTAVVDSSDTCTDGSLGTGSLVCKNAAEAAAAMTAKAQAYPEELCRALAAVVIAIASSRAVVSPNRGPGVAVNGHLSRVRARARACRVLTL